MKYKRQGQIIKIVREKQIRTHEQLINELKEQGFNVTQATVSRDIKELGLVKIPSSEGGSVYSVPPAIARDADKHLDIFSNTVKEINYALHTVVIKTYPGMASAVAASVDSTMHDDFLGSIAGDDTIIMITETESKAEVVTEKLRKLFRTKGE